MKKLILALSMLAAQQSFAAPATQYVCQGLDKVSGETLAFEVLCADHGPFDGYTNQSVTVVRPNGSTVTFQMYGATKKNNCKLNGEGEYFIRGGFNHDEVVTLKVNCGPGVKFDIKGACEIAR